MARVGLCSVVNYYYLYFILYKMCTNLIWSYGFISSLVFDVLIEDEGLMECKGVNRLEH